ncbi:WD40 repeat domain-containing protein [Candidatus Dependentiae bacterium]|nr:WD40 repeat domain-containing protein [Candidatus Dependentiae bacterium]
MSTNNSLLHYLFISLSVVSSVFTLLASEPRLKELPTDVQHTVAVSTLAEVLPYLEKNRGSVKFFKTDEMPLAINPDRTLSATRGFKDTTIELVEFKTGNEFKTGKKIHTVSNFPNTIHTAAFSPDGKKLATGWNTKKILIWDVQSGQKIATVQIQNKQSGPLAFSSNGEKIAVVEGDTVEIQDLNTKAEPVILRGHTNHIYALAFSPDDKKIATGSQDLTAKIWDNQTGEELKTLGGHTQLVDSVAFSPDGKRIVTASGDHTAKVWDTNSGDELLTLQGHTESVNDAAFSRNGKLIATAAWDNKVKLWNAENGTELITFHDNYVYNYVTFDPHTEDLYTIRKYEPRKFGITVWSFSSFPLEWLKKQVTLPQALLILKAYEAKIAGTPFTIPHDTEDYRIFMGIHPDVRMFLEAGLSINLTWF